METIKNISQGVLIGLFFLLTACTTDKGPVFTDLEEITEISYSAEIQPIFTDRCIICHDQTHETGLNLKAGFSYDLLVNVTTFGYAPNVRIKPFSKEESVLWHKIIGDDMFGSQMPLIGEPLSNFQMEKIGAWIELGAPDN